MTLPVTLPVRLPVTLPDNAPVNTPSAAPNVLIPLTFRLVKLPVGDIDAIPIAG